MRVYFVSVFSTKPLASGEVDVYIFGLAPVVKHKL